jgi:phosphoribosylformimino-5-aminoimidazole carboxamide ribotide isomerase
MMEIFVAIDIFGGRVVRLLRGDPSRAIVYGDDPVAMALRWESDGAQALHLIDLDAALARGSQRAMIGRIAARVRIPLQVGGGVRSEAHVEELFDLGATQVVLGTLAFGDRAVVARLLERYGPDRIVVALDADHGRVRIEGWTKDVGLTVEEAAQGFLALGARRFLVTAVQRDGTLAGPDLDLFGRLVSLSESHLIASGGIHQVGDILSLERVGAKGVVVGRALYEGRLSVADLRWAASGVKRSS